MTIELQSRRKELRWQRRLKFWQSTWRLVCLSGLSFGLFWTMRLPYWCFTQPEQISISGHKLLTPADILSYVDWEYPKYIWSLDNQKLIEQLESQEPILDAKITRQLFPLAIKIHVQERKPVGLVVSPRKDTQVAARNPILLGFLDKEGVFIPVQFYDHSMITSILAQKNLRVMGYQAQYQESWVKIQQFSQNSPIEVFQVTWQTPTSLFLATEIGVFYLGNYQHQLQQQLEAITRMQTIPAQLDMSTVTYIDLSNPEAPVVRSENDE